jgi:predicted GNAT superfamily acetyltransferase
MGEPTSAVTLAGGKIPFQPGVAVRRAVADDHLAVSSLLKEWWGGRDLTGLLPRLFFEHFRETAFIAESDGQLVGFLVGFLSQTHPEEAYVHFCGVRPDRRRSGLGRALYEHFFAVVAAQGRTVVRCVTSPVNTVSVAFHQRLGFALEPGDVTVGGMRAHADHDGPGEARVQFVKHLNGRG